MSAEISFKVEIKNGRPRTVPQVAVPATLIKGPTPTERTFIIRNADAEDNITFFFPTAHDRNAFEDPSSLVKDSQPKVFVLPPGGEERFVVRPMLGVIRLHDEKPNRVYSFDIITEPLIFNPHTDHEVGHIEC